MWPNRFLNVVLGKVRLRDFNGRQSRILQAEVGIGYAADGTQTQY